MEKVKLMNMCQISNPKDNTVLVQERVKSWKGIAFPGGKLNPGESVVTSTIREVKEETGLDITNLELCGIKEWYNQEENERSIIFLYKTSTFKGNLILETDEGKNYWVEKDKLTKEQLANNFDIMLKVFDKDYYTEMIYNDKKDTWDLL